MRFGATPPPGRGDREEAFAIADKVGSWMLDREILSFSSLTFVFIVLFVEYHRLGGSCMVNKGSCHLRFSGIRPLRGGGYPPFPLRKKTFFFSD